MTTWELTHRPSVVKWMAHNYESVEQNNEAPTDVTPSPNHVVQMEPNILDILNDE